MRGESAGIGEREDYVDNRLFQLAPWRKAGSWILSLSGRLLTGVGLAVVSPTVASGARKNDRREDDQNANDRGKEETKEDQGSNNQGEKQQTGEKSDQDTNKNSGPQSESHHAEDKNAKREQHNDRASEKDHVSDESAGDERGRVTHRQEARAEANDAGGSNNDGGNTRRTQELEQRRNRDDEPADEPPADEPPAEEPTTPAPVVPTNPNVPADTPTGIPELTDAELIVQGNEDVIASVSTSGGFAFARSGNVIAISGPDGAQIIQSDEPIFEPDVAPSPAPEEPSPDGGDNGMDFTS
jgi:hypothetical protein